MSIQIKTDGENARFMKSGIVNKKEVSIYITDNDGVKAVREELNCNIEAFAFYMGVTSDCIRKWERGDRRVSKTAKKLMAMYLETGICL